MTIFSEESNDAVRELTAKARQTAKILKAEAEEATRIQKVWDDLSFWMGENWLLHILDLMRREAELLKKLRADNHPSIQALESIHQVAKENADAQWRRFVNNVDAACAAEQLPLDRESSRHPRYTFEKGFIHLEIDDYKRVAKLSDYEGELDQFPADVPAIVQAVKKEHKRLFARPFDGKSFLQKLRRSYLAILDKQKEPDGTSLPLRRITTRLGKNEDKFRTDEFLVDLSRLVERGPAELDGCRFELQQTKDTNQGMLLHGVAGQGYIGFIVFRKV